MDPMVLILGIGGAVALILLVIGLVISARSDRSSVDERLGRYIKEEVEETKRKDETRTTPIGDWLDRRIEKTSYAGGISRDLARADIKLKVGEYIATLIIFAVGTAFVFWYLMDRENVVPVFTIVGFAIGLNIPRIFVKRQQAKRMHRFEGQLADMLNLMVNGLRAGYSTMQAMESVSRELAPPIADEFRRVVQEMQIGLSMSDALSNLLRRIPSGDLDLVITAMNVQRDVGGNLAEILDTISYTIRERVRIKGEIRVLTSQVMYSGRFLAMMPLIISGILWLVNRPYMMQFFNPETRLIGIIALSFAMGMVIAGYFMMMKIANIDI